MFTKEFLQQKKIGFMSQQYVQYETETDKCYAGMNRDDGHCPPARHKGPTILKGAPAQSAGGTPFRQSVYFNADEYVFLKTLICYSIL